LEYIVAATSMTTSNGTYAVETLNSNSAFTAKSMHIKESKKRKNSWRLHNFSSNKEDSPGHKYCMQAVYLLYYMI